MNQEQYERQMAARTGRYESRKQGRIGAQSYLERKIAARRGYFAHKRKATDKKFEGRKQAKILKGRRKMDMKAAKFSARMARWGKGWDKMRAKWEARVRKHKT